MKWYKFDKKVNQEMTDHKSEVDIDALWGDIEADVDAINMEKKKRRRFLFFWFFFGVLALGSGVSYFGFNGNGETEMFVEIVGERTQGDLESTIGLNKESTTSEVETEIKSLEKAVQDNINTTGQGVNTKNESIATKNKDIEEKKKKTQNAKKAGDLATSNTMSGETVGRKFQRESTKSQNEPVLIFDESSVREIPLAGKEKEELIILDEDGVETLDASNNENTLVPLEVEKDLPLPEDNSNIDKLGLENLAHSLLSKKEDDWNLTDLDFKKKRNFQLSFSLLGSLSYTKRKLEIVGEGNFINLLKHWRDSTESILETSQLGLQVHWQHKSGIEFSTGINFTQINERFEYKAKETEVELIDGILFYYVNVKGDTIVHFGDVPETTITTYDQRHFNKIRLIEIPLLVAYRKQFNRFSFGAQAGVFVNVKMTASGKVFGLGDSRPIVFNEGTYDNLKTNFNLSYHFGLLAEYQITDHWSITASPFLRVFPKNYMESQYQLRQQYQLYGGQLGVRYLLY